MQSNGLEGPAPDAPGDAPPFDAISCRLAYMSRTGGSQPLPAIHIESKFLLRRRSFGGSRTPHPIDPDRYRHIAQHIRHGTHAGDNPVYG